MMNARLLMLIFLTISSVSFALADDEQKALDAIGKAEAAVNEMQQAGLGTQRAGDILEEARLIYSAQKDGDKDFSLVIKKTDEILSLKDGAFAVSDELNALRLQLDSAKETLDITDAEEIYSTAAREFGDERYEQSMNAISAAYDKLSEIEAKSTTASALYDAATSGVSSFIYANWMQISAAVIIILIILLFTYKRIIIHRIKGKIRRLEIEKATLNELIKRTQKEYFEKGNIPESTYNIRIKKFGEMMRDIDRQIPVLREQIAKAKGVKIKKRKKIILAKPRVPAKSPPVRGSGK